MTLCTLYNVLDSVSNLKSIVTLALYKLVYYLFFLLLLSKIDNRSNYKMCSSTCWLVCPSVPDCHKKWKNRNKTI